MSLLFMMQGLDHEKYEPIVALIKPSKDLVDLYQSHGFKVVSAPGIGLFAHTTGGYARLLSFASIRQFFQQIFKFNRSKRETLNLIKKTRPDLVHLNSAVLLPSALALINAELPFVWHIRECPPNDGLRTRLIGKAMLKADHVIYLSEHDRKAWTKDNHGTVVHNFVDFNRFDRTIDKMKARKDLGLSETAPQVLYLGAAQLIKGFFVLIEAIPLVLRRYPEVRFIMPSAKIYPSNRLIARTARKILPMVGTGTAGQRLFKRMAKLGISHAVEMLPFSKDVVRYIAASDVLVFPSTAPHFARPVIEASAMAKPVVGSNIGGVNELIDEGKTGLLIPPCNPSALSDAICRILEDPVLAQKMGEEGYEMARQRFCAEKNIMKAQEIYERLLQ